MPMLEGLDESTCEELQETHSGLEENKEAIAEHMSDEVQERMENGDLDFSEALEETELPVDVETLRGLESVRRKVRYTASLGCGLSYANNVETDYDFDGDEISDEVVEDAYAAVDDAGTGVRETTPDYIYSGDMIYEEIAGEENQKRVFQDHANRTLDALEDFADDDLPDRETTGTAVAQQIECKYADPEKRQECLDQYSDFDVKSSGLAGVGDPLPRGWS